MESRDRLLGGVGGGSTETCPWCGAALTGAGDGGWVEGRFECPNCEGGVFFMEGGALVDSMHRGSRSGGGSCEMCQASLARGERCLPWENGSNAHAYIKCPSCGHENVRYGFGEDDGSGA